MKKAFFIAAVAVAACLTVPAATVPVIVYQVRVALTNGDLPTARNMLKQYRTARGTRPDYIEALSWVGRAELSARRFAAAEENAAEVRRLCLDSLGPRRLDSSESLATALGASIEVQALAATQQGRRDQAVTFLREEVRRWRDTSIRARIQKNLNLLTLEGKPAPPLDITQSLTTKKLQPLAQHHGHPVLLFFWAHWCSDCKNQIAIIEKLQRVYGPRGFEVIAPTQHYGYVAGGQDAPPAVETAYIKAIRSQFYSGLGQIGIPLSEENFANYGVSTTPTLVLVDKNGIVRLYNPGNATYEALATKVSALL